MTGDYTVKHCNTLDYTVEQTTVHCNSDKKQGLTLQLVYDQAAVSKTHCRKKSTAGNKYKCTQ